MGLASTLKLGVDLPAIELLRFLPVATAATSGFCASDKIDDRYIYYLSGSTFYRYDVYTNTYQLLASPNIAPVTAVSLKYSAFGGYRCNCLGATANTVDIPGLESKMLEGLTIRITSGKGAGQEKTIVSCSENKILDHGIVTSASATSIGDSTKKWRFNEFIGCALRLVYNTGQSQIRNILYHDINTIAVSDPNYQQLDQFNNTGFSAVAPYAVPVTTAGSQAHYYIEKSTLTLSSDWDIIPDATSSFMVISGCIYCVSSVATAPWSSFQMYDILSDKWVTRTAIGGLLLAALGTDFGIERFGEVGGAFASGTATSATSRSLIDSSKTFNTDSYCNYQIRITGGTGQGQRKRIVGNTTTSIEVASKWDTTPDATSTYAIYGDTDKIILAGNGASAMYKYNVEVDLWYQGLFFDSGIARNMSASYDGQEAFGITTAIRNTGAIREVNSIPTAGGTGYTVGDILNVTTGGTNGRVRVTSITTGGVVTGIEVFACGSAYTTGTGKATSVVTGSGSGLTIEITTIGNVGTITLATNHNLCIGDQVKISGCSDLFWNSSCQILGIFSSSVIEIPVASSSTAVAASSQSTTVLVDSSKNWTVNEHVGKLVSINTFGTAPTTQVRRITANTDNTLTLQSAITAAVNGTSRYIIHAPEAFGRAEQYRVKEKKSFGRATSGSTTTLVDSSKNWNVGQWVGYKVRIVSGTGLGAEISITSNTSNTLTFTTPQTFTPDSTTKYIIMDTFGLATAGSTTTLTDSTKNWSVNQWAGKRCKITSGTGTGQEFTITSNTATALTFTAITTAPGTDSTYTILDMQTRSTSIELSWLFGSSDLNVKGNFVIIPKGGANVTVDRYDIVNDLMDLSWVLTPQAEAFNTGTMYCYDGKDYIYIQIAATQRIVRLNINTGKVDGVGMLPYPHGNAIIGNRLEIFKADDTLSYLLCPLHSRMELYKIPVFV